mgnify:CR=1 FL=1
MILAIIQARVNSTRLPNKIFSDIEGKPLIWHVVNRIKSSKKNEKIVIATSVNPLDDKLEEWCIKNNLDCFRGSEDNVLERFYFAARKYNGEIIVRITADDPFKDPEIIDEVINILISENLDFAYNNYPPSFPEGLDTEVFTFRALEKAYQSTNDPFELEHVTQFFYRNPQLFKQKNFSFKKNISNLRWTIDTEKDLEMARAVYKFLYKENEIFLLNDILSLLEKENWIEKINLDTERSTMYKNYKVNNEKD